MQDDLLRLWDDLGLIKAVLMDIRWEAKSLCHLVTAYSDRLAAIVVLISVPAVTRVAMITYFMQCYPCH